jgi:hypothetical protein
MTWEQVKDEALRLVNEVASRRSDLELTEYHNPARYHSDFRDQWTMQDHNAIVRAAMREATRRGVYCVRRIVR